jgi:UDP-N-acetylmuramyl pentapeptide phosphotransferase/UDP-N-acetylglucosamine-1-phosphate transferase
MIAAVLVPFLTSLFVCGLMIRFGPKDAPDGGRKTQAAPVPSSGGVGILAGAAAGLVALTARGADLTGLLTAPPLAGLAGFCVFAALLGWLDDAKGLPAAAKLLALSGAATGAALLGTAPAAVTLGGAAMLLPGAVGVMAAAAVIFVMANALNFMDGANGIAMGTALIILTVLVLLLAPSAALRPDRPDLALLAGLLLASAAALGGFLFWNLRGRLYAGDAGALSVGGLIGAASVIYASVGPVLVPLTLCLPLLVDVFMTLAWRARRGERLMQAHRDHAYQLLLRAGWPHVQVARLWWGLTAVCAGAVVAGPFAAQAGAYDAGGLPVDVLVFGVLLAAGVGLWLRQRRTLGAKLAAEGK